MRLTSTVIKTLQTVKLVGDRLDKKTLINKVGLSEEILDTLVLFEYLYEFKSCRKTWYSVISNPISSAFEGITNSLTQFKIDL